MHPIAVYTLAAVALWTEAQTAQELFVAWYSGADPPLSPGQVRWICCRMLVVVAAIAAIVTL